MAKEKVALIVLPDRIDFEPLVYPPLGLLYVASSLKEEYDVSIFDLREEKDIKFYDCSKLNGFDVYGFSITTCQLIDAIDLCKIIKINNKKSFCVVGGPGVLIGYEKEFKDFDAYFVGEVEKIIVKSLKEKRRGCIDCRNDYENIDSISFPNRDLLDSNKIISSKIWEGSRFGEGDMATTIITSRGCSWKCSFCTNISKGVRFRSVDNVMKEIEEIQNKFNCNHFRFLDDNILENRNRVKSLCLNFEKNNINFRCSTRANLIDEEICEYLVRGGCKEVGFGLEVADDYILRKLNKKEKVSHYEKALKILKAFDIKSKVFLMSGLPYETWETVEKNKSFISKNKPNKLIITLFTPYPGSDIYENPKKYDVEIKNRDWNLYYQSYPAKSNISTNICDSIELEKHYESMIKFLEDYIKCL